MTDKYNPQKKYRARNMKKLNVELNINTDKDILDYLETVPNKAKLVKQLLRDHIKKELEGQ